MLVLLDWSVSQLRRRESAADETERRSRRQETAAPAWTFFRVVLVCLWRTHGPRPGAIAMAKRNPQVFDCEGVDWGEAGLIARVDGSCGAVVLGLTRRWIAARLRG